jgi:hypothetical protein
MPHAKRGRASPRAKPRSRRRKTVRKAVRRAATVARIKATPPSRTADPFAKKTGRRRTYYTSEFLAEAKRRIETTLQSTTAIANDFGMHQNVLWRLVRHYGWVRPQGSLRLRGLSPAMQLAAAAAALTGAAPSGDGHPAPALADPFRPGEGGTAPAAAASADTSALDRLERAVLKELTSVETMRASLGAEPLRPMDAERTARTLASLTETLAKLRRLRLAGEAPSGPHDDDDMPADIDAFRRDLARRIDAFVASRTEPGDAGGGSGSAPVDEAR